jgi:glycolate oxidase FAD binding subunit
MQAIDDLRVVEPESERAVSEALSCADRDGLAVIPRGGGTKLDWGNPPSRADLVLSMARLSRVIEHAWADLTVTVEAGCTIAELQGTLAEHGQRLAIDVLWPESATVGGILSTNDSGALRLRYGGLRDLIIGITLVLADGTIARSGGKVVKNVAGYDLPKLATGALGTLGVITQAIFRLHPVPHGKRTLTVLPRRIAEAQTLLLALQDSTLAYAALQVRCGASMAPEMDILLEGTEAGMEAQAVRIRAMARPAAVNEAEAPRIRAITGSGAGKDGSEALWGAREEIAAAPCVARFSVLPSQIGAVLEALGRLADRQWRAVVQATGIGWASVNAPLGDLRAKIESGGGTLTVLRQPAGAGVMDAWGDTGDTLLLMREIKRRFDPNGTLNPGRFVGGI